jgi:N-acetylmuramoyl-L-alanine amidase
MADGNAPPCRFRHGEAGDGELVIDSARNVGRQSDVQPAKALPEGRGQGPTLVIALVEVRQQDRQDGGLHLVEARVAGLLAAYPGVVPAIGAQAAEAAGRRGVPAGDSAAVADRAEVLRRIERESGGVPVCPELAAVDLGADGLGAVLDDRKPALFGERGDARHVRRVAEQMHRDDRRRARRDRRLDGARIHAPGRRVDIDKTRHGTRRHDSLGGSGGGQGHGDDLVAGPDAKRPQRQGQGVRAVADADAVAGVQVAGEVGLEAFDGRTEDVPVVVQDPGHGGVDLATVLADAQPRRGLWNLDHGRTTPGLRSGRAGDRCRWRCRRTAWRQGP